MQDQQPPELPKPWMHDLWKHLHDEHGLTLLESEIFEIVRLATPVWHPIETAPKDGSWILLYDPTTSRLIHVGCWDAKFESKWNEETDDLEYIGNWTAYEVQSFSFEEYAALAPTHWMPLPTPPQV